MRLLVRPDTVLRWHRDLVRRRWAAKSRHKQPGRPRKHPQITRLVLRMARENPWGYRRITGELAGLGITVAPSTVWEILKRHGIDPAPQRSGPSWAQFLRSQAEAIIACDFFTVDLLDGTKAYVLAVIEHAARRIHILGATAHPTAEWVTQQARNMLMDLEEGPGRVKFLIRDRDILYPPGFDQTLADAGITTVHSAVRAPRMNSIMEQGAPSSGSGAGPDLPTRTTRPHPDLGPAPPPAAPAQVRDVPQPAPAAQGIAACPPHPPPAPLEVADLPSGHTTTTRLGGILHEYQQAA